MQKIVLLCLAIVSSVILHAQNIVHKIELRWKKTYEIDLNGRPVSMMGFEGAIYPNHPFVPEWTDEFNLPAGFEIQAVNIQKVDFKPVNTNEALTLDEYGFIPDTIHARYIKGIGKKQGSVQVSILPYAKNNATRSYSKLAWFELSLIIAPEPKKIISNTGRTYASESLLASGRWIKFSVKESGMYKITFDDLKNTGLDPSKINPRNIRMFSYGGAMLPEANYIQRPDDMAEIAVTVVGEDDGVFNTQDYVLFYGDGPHQWKFLPATRVFEHQTNYYSDFSFYFLTADKGPGKRIIIQPSLSQPANMNIEVFDDLQVHKKNEVNLIKSGREWYGEVFEAVTYREVNFTIPGLVTDSLIRCRVQLAARSFVGSSFSLDLSGTQVSVPIGAVSSISSYLDFARETVIIRNITSQGEQVKLKFTYNRSTVPSIGWLHSVTLQSKRRLSMTGDQMIFRSVRSVGSQNISEFRLSNAPPSTLIWDVTDFFNVAVQQVAQQGNTQVFRLATPVLREFIACDPAKAMKPTFAGLVENQNLHGMATPEMIIITHPDFVSEANRLATFHATYSSIDARVVTTVQVNNEFSSGKQDVTAIRDFVKMLYDRSTPGKSLKYLLLFGDASYDYKSRVKNNNNMVPCWQSPASLHASNTYATDDFFGYLEDHEGTQLNDDLDIGIGRLPVTTLQQATQMVDKIIRYAVNRPENLGEWRNVICFVADDEDGNLHIDQAETLAEIFETNYPSFNLDKIYLDAYPQQRTPGGQRYPAVNRDINQRIEKGALVMNYTGHGGTLGWAHERVLEINDINSWNNTNKMPLFITATCEFAYYDDPEVLSAGELVLLNPKGGGIGLYTTTRPTYASNNSLLNQRIYNHMFIQQNNDYLRLGDIMRLAKQNTGPDINTRKFILLGDPALQLAAPRYDVVTTHINQQPVNGSIDTLKALSFVTVSGMIADQQGNIISNYAGEVVPVIFDKPVNVSTLTNDGGVSYQFPMQKSIIYRGKSSIVNGRFQFSFIVPKDIAYQFGNGKISYYATDGTTDAHGSNSNIIIGGFNQNANIDRTGPRIKLYINDEHFRSGGTTSENPVIYAMIEDESGINTTGSGIGHDIVAVLDGQTDKLIVLNDYYTADLDTYTRGRIVYPFFNLSEGKHTLWFKVWDVFNNSSEETIDFYVKTSGKIQLSSLSVYPNPFVHSTKFYLEHNQAGTEIQILLLIFSLDGRLRKSDKFTIIPSGYNTMFFEWDGRDDTGSPLPGGIYICRSLITAEGKKAAEASCKLVVVKP